MNLEEPRYFLKELDYFIRKSHHSQFLTSLEDTKKPFASSKSMKESWRTYNDCCSYFLYCYTIFIQYAKLIY